VSRRARRLKHFIVQCSLIRSPRASAVISRLPVRFVRRGYQHADAPHALAPLRTRSQRPPRRRTAQKREEIAPSIKKMSSHGTTAEDVGAAKKHDQPGAYPPVSSTRVGRKGRCVTHSITSASNWIELGTSRPSALAVCRLMTNSNLVDCKTGRSAGFAPLRI
jgi:hypothetical protein